MIRIDESGKYILIKLSDAGKKAVDVLKTNPPPTIGSLELEERLSDVVDQELGIALHLASLILMNETEKAVEYSEKLRIAYADFLEKSIFMINEVRQLRNKKRN